MIETRSQTGSVVIAAAQLMLKPEPDALIQESIPNGARVLWARTLDGFIGRQDLEVFYEREPRKAARPRTKLNRRASRAHGIPQEEPPVLGRRLR